MKKIAIVGAGPSGIFLARFLQNLSGEVHLFEQNADIGEKLKLTGGGRMNILNERFSVEDFSSASPQLLKNLFKNPLSKKIPQLAKSLEMEWKWEGHRAILASENAKKEVLRFKILLQHQKNCTLRLGTSIVSIEKKIEKNTEKNAEKFCVKSTIVAEKKTQIEFFDAVVLCTGGMFRLHDLGEKEKIFSLPLSLGHSITPVLPSLSPLLFKNHPLKRLTGIAVRGKISLSENETEKNDKNDKNSITDDFLITHFGLSGPAVLDFSSFVDEKIEKIFVCFLPQFSKSQWNEKILEWRKGKISIKKTISSFVPNRLAEFLLEKAQISSIFFADLSKEKEKNLEKLLFSFPLLSPQKFPYPACWTTKGGIPLTEISVATLESKIHQNLFFAGEMLDASGLCGGYNISFALLSAKIVAEKIDQKILKEMPSL